MSNAPATCEPYFMKPLSGPELNRTSSPEPCNCLFSSRVCKKLSNESSAPCAGACLARERFDLCFHGRRRNGLMPSKLRNLGDGKGPTRCESADSVISPHCASPRFPSLSRSFSFLLQQSLLCSGQRMQAVPATFSSEQPHPLQELPPTRV